MKVRYSYLEQQFQDAEDLWLDLKKFVATGDFTLGKPLNEFEQRFSELIGSRYAVGVNSGTDAIKLSLKVLGVGYGDEVITAANTFVATVGAIAEVGAIPVFVDCDNTFCMDPGQIEEAISEKTKAILPVHYTGYMADLRRILPIADRHGIPLIEDACQAILGAIDGKTAGTWGRTGAFSLHPLKNLNVWADGGVIVTDDSQIYARLKLIRNHGLLDRDTVAILGCNSRLDTIQAVVGNWLLPTTHEITKKRIVNATYYDNAFRGISEIKIPTRPSDYKIVYHLYMVLAERRDELLRHCIANGIEAKIHYPVPIYLQPALLHLGHKQGDYPVADEQAKSTITFPCDQHLTRQEIDYVIQTVTNFYQS